MTSVFIVGVLFGFEIGSVRGRIRRPVRQSGRNALSPESHARDARRRNSSDRPSALRAWRQVSGTKTSEYNRPPPIFLYEKSVLSSSLYTITENLHPMRAH